tara:strand:+ start:137 stop:1081 length:945 start_codon:yes stop_codon:yes gene_type:complete
MDVAKQASEVGEAATAATKQVGDAMNTAITASSDGIKTAVSNITTNSGALMGLLVVIVVAAICSIIVYYLVIDNVFKKKSITIAKTKTPVKGNVLSTIPIDSMPSSGNGFRRTYGFWIYLDNMNNNKGRFKHVWHIGSQNDSVGVASPMVFLDKEKNKMYVRFAKKNGSGGFDQNRLNDLSDKFDEYIKNAVEIDYIPMQRWVHVGIVVTDSIDGGVVQVYLDAELASSSSSGNDNKDFDNMDLDKGGSLVIGGNNGSGEDPGFEGLISKVSIWNYDLNSRDIYNAYADGPIDGMLASLGYGLRTPIYKLNSDE